MYGTDVDLRLVEADLRIDLRRGGDSRLEDEEDSAGAGSAATPELLLS